MKATMRIENTLIKKGHNLICGIDEVGRGSLAGPLVAACVILPREWRIGLKDSKMLTPKLRQSLADQILSGSLAYGIGWVDNSELDELGLTKAVRTAYLRALEKMPSEFSLAIIDGNYNYLEEFGIAQTLVKADSKVSCVAAASIIAKVARDEYMKEQSTEHPDYGFDSNVGYATQKHLQAIESNGLTDLHRRSFCKKYL